VSLRRVLAAAAVLALALGVAVLAVMVWFPAERVRALAVARLEEALGRQVTFDAVGLGLGGIHLRGLTVSAVPDFEAGTLLSARDLVVRLRLLPLLQRRVEVSWLAIEDWRCTLRTGAPKPEEAEQSRTRAASAVTALGVASLESHGGTLEWTDAGGDTQLELRDVEARADDLRLDGPFRARVHFAYAGRLRGHPLEGTLEFTGTLDLGSLDPRRLAIEAEPLHVVWNGVPFDLDGRLNDTTTPHVAVRVSVPALSRAQLDALGLGRAAGAEITPATAHLGVEPTPDGYRVTLADVTAGRQTAQAKGTVSARAIAIESLEIARGDDSLRARGTIGTPDDAPAALDLGVETSSFPAAELAALVPVPDGIAVDGRVAVDARVTGTSRAPRFAGTATLDGVSLTRDGRTLLGDLAGPVRLGGDTIAADLSGRLGGGRLEMQASLADWARAPALRIQASVSDLDLAAVAGLRGASAPAPAGATPADEDGRPLAIAGWIKAGRVHHTGFRAAPGRADFDLAGVGGPTRGLDGSAAIRLGAGEFTDIGGATDTHPLLRLLLLPFDVLARLAPRIPGFPSFDRVSFREIVGRYTIRRGLMRLDDSHLDGSVGLVTVGGTVDLPTERLDLHAGTTVDTRLGVRIPTPVGVSMRGTLSDPSVIPDPRGVLDQPLVGEIGRETVGKGEEAGKKVLEKGRGLLRRIIP
jgi:AsmA-like C-terminal region